ncbi:MAG: phosphatase PAP2 family protein [Acidobacteriota bacterium]
MPKIGEHRVVWMIRRFACFLRYTYPLPIVLFFFQEVRFTVNSMAPETPYWFESYLYAWDRAIFGELPAVVLADWVTKPLTELMHAFYFAYYLILIGGLLVAWWGVEKSMPPGEANKNPVVNADLPPGPGFSSVITAMTLAFVLSFLHYPFLPARGPWENPELMSRLPHFQGVIFKPLIDLIIGHGAVSGGCFPSSHVAASWGTVLGLGAVHRRAARWFGIVAVGMSVACVYTRYHHGVDVPAGLLVGLLGGWIGRKLAESPH